MLFLMLLIGAEPVPVFVVENRIPVVPRFTVESKVPVAAPVFADPFAPCTSPNCPAPQAFQSRPVLFPRLRGRP